MQDVACLPERAYPRLKRRASNCNTPPDARACVRCNAHGQDTEALGIRHSVPSRSGDKHGEHTAKEDLRMNRLSSLPHATAQDPWLQNSLTRFSHPLQSSWLPDSTGYGNACNSFHVRLHIRTHHRQAASIVRTAVQELGDISHNGSKVTPSSSDVSVLSSNASWPKFPRGIPPSSDAPELAASVGTG